MKEKVNKGEQRDVIHSLERLTSYIQIRNAAKIQSRQGPTEDRVAWVQIYKRCIVEIDAIEGELAAVFPSASFRRRLFLSIG